jgi:hypothetical protein
MRIIIVGGLYILFPERFNDTIQNLKQQVAYGSFAAEQDVFKYYNDSDGKCYRWNPFSPSLFSR